MRSPCLLSALLVASCGRVGFDNEVVPGSEPDASVATVDGRSSAIRDGGPVCEGEPGEACSGLTLGAGIGSMQNIGTNLMNYPSPIVPTCEPGANVAESRVMILAPPEPALLQVEVDASFDTVVTVLQDGCAGAVDSCTSVPAASGTVVEIIMSPDEQYVISVASSTSCGNAALVLRSSALGSG